MTRQNSYSLYIQVDDCQAYVTEPSMCHSNFALNFFCLDFFLAFKFFSRLFSPTFFPPLITYACVNGTFRHLGNRNNMSRPNEGEKNAVDNVSFNELI